MRTSKATSAPTRILNVALAAALVATVFASIPGADADPQAGLKPDVVSGKFLDTDRNGRFDRVEITFAPDLTSGNTDKDRSPVVSTIRPSDFSVSGMVVIGCVVTGSDCQNFGTASSVVIRLRLEESISYQTGGTLPAISYTRGTIVDVDGEFLENDSTITSIDGASPMPLAAYAKATDTTIAIPFSEAISNHNRGTEKVAAGTEKATDSNIDAEDVCFDADGPAGSGPDFTHWTGASASGSTFTLTLANGLSEPQAATADLYFDESGGTLVGNDCDQSRHTLADAASTPNLVDPTERRRVVTLGTSFVAGAYADVGSTEVLYIFNGPVAALTGADFQYINQNPGGATGIQSVTHSAGSNVALITLDLPIVSGDIGTDQIRVLANRVVAFGDSDNKITGAVEKALDSAFPETPTPATPTGFASLVHNRLVPRPTAAATVDIDLNGVLDAVLVLFSEEVSGDFKLGFTVRGIQGTSISAATKATTAGVAATAGANCGVGVLTPTVIPNAMYICLDQAGAVTLATGVPVGVSYDATAGNLKDHGMTAVASFANLAAGDGARPVLKSYKTLDANDNGQLDRIELTFSEAIKDSSFLSSEWTVKSKGPDGVIGTSDDVAYGVDAALETGMNANDAIIILKLVERATPDTGVIPALKFARNGGLVGLSDNLGPANFDLTVNPATGPASKPLGFDGALPVIVSVGATVSSNTLVLTFSEPVWTSTGMPSSPAGNLHTGDFVYNNNNAAGAAGVSGVSFQAGSSTGTITLGGVITQSDFDGPQRDTLTLNSGAVFDAADQAGRQVTRAFVSIGNPTIVSISTLDLNTGTGLAGVPDGKIDRLKVTFSEPIVDGASCANLEVADFSVKIGGVPVPLLGVTTYRNDFDGNCVLDGAASGNEGNDDTIYVVWDGSVVAPGAEQWNTAALPTLSYDNNGNLMNIKAADDNAPLAPVTDRAATDGANPVLMKASGSGKSLSLTFSEPVKGSGTGNVLRIQDFAYLDNAAGGASAMASIGSHTPPAAAVTATMNQDFTTSDINVDAVQAKSTVVDAVGLSATGATRIIRDGTAPTLLQVATVDADGNGLIDAVRVRFNEPVADGPGCTSIDATGPWSLTVGGNAVAITSIVSSATGAPCDAAGANDADIFIRFAEAASRHTGIRPTVAYDASHPDAEIADPAGNKLGTIGDTQALDRANPVLLSSEATVGAKQAATQDLDGDGRLDGFRLVFSEPIQDSTFKNSDWAAGNAGNGNAHTITGISTGSSADDAVIVVTFSEGSAFDTAEKPTLTYSGTSGLTDAAGNKLAAMGTGAIEIIDRARPTIVVMSATTGNTAVGVQFSEPVWNAPGQPFSGHLETSDFAYTNGNAAGAGGLSAITHTAGNKDLDLTLDQAPTATDLQEDLIGPQAAAIFDAAGNAATFAPVNLHGDVFDAIAPGQIDDLGAAKGLEEVTLQWTTPSDTDLRQFDIRISTSAIDSDTAFDAAASVTAGTIGNAATIPAPVAGGIQRLTITGLTAGTEYCFAMTVSDNSGNTAPRSNGACATPDAPDTTPPGQVTLEFVSATGNSLTFQWTPVGDDAFDGTVDKYEVKISTSPITTAAEFDAAATAAAVFDPVSLLAGGSSSKQKVTVTQIGGIALAADTTYYVAVRGVDESGNKGTFAGKEGLTLGRDLSAPIGSLIISSSTHQLGIATRNNDPTFSWSGLTDAESSITYYYALNANPDYVPSASDTGQTAGTSASFQNIAPGEWYFHVIGISQGGESEPASYHIVIQQAVTADEIAAANNAVRATVNVTREGNSNIVTWDLSGIDPAPSGVDIWRSTSPFVKIATLVGEAAFAGTYTDVGAPKDAKYIVTVWYEQIAAGGYVDSLSDASGYEGKSDEELAAMAAQAPAEDTTPAEKKGLLNDWPFWVGLAVLLAAIVVVVVGAVRYSRSRRD